MIDKSAATWKWAMQASDAEDRDGEGRSISTGCHMNRRQQIQGSIEYEPTAQSETTKPPYV
jgi:hypothetical protein